MLNNPVCRDSAPSYQAQTSRQGTFKVQLLDLSHPERRQVERFVLSGYQRAFNAHFSDFMPHLVALSQGKHRAVLGIRHARQPLFIEQYLQRSVEDLSLFRQLAVPREQIAEIGNLYSSAKPLTLPLFLITALALLVNQQRFMVFAATEHVFQLISRTGITPQVLCPAKKELLQKNQDDWGSYYDTEPNVVAIDLKQVVQIINRSSKYSLMFEQLSEEIAGLSTELTLGLSGQHMHGGK